MTKVAFISTLDHLPWGGSEELWMRAALRLREQKVDVHVSVQWWPQPVAAIMQLERAGCRIHFRRRPTMWARLSRRNQATHQCNWLGREAPDLVVISQGGHYDGLSWMRECHRRDLPYTTIVQNAPEFHWPADSVLLELEHLYRASQRNFFVSQGNIELVSRQVGRSIANAVVVRNPFNVSYNAAPAWPQGEELRLACVAQLTPVHKGQDLLFEVLHLPKWKERPLRVSLWGEGGNKRTLETLRETYGLTGVTFNGFAYDIEAVWREHHAMILPSRCEGTPLAVVEAMLCGRPCIVTAVAGNAEVVEDNDTGFIAAAPTPALLDEAMERAWEKRALWSEMGERAARRIRELVPPDPVGVFTNQLMKEVMR